VVPGNDQSTQVSNCFATDFVPTYALQIIQSVELRAQPAVYAQELLVHNRSQRQCAERVHAGFVNRLRVLVLTLQLECEVISQMPTFVVSTEQPERVWVPDLQRPQVENAL
jgi:CBS-domain-containing membrane protein